MESGFYSVTCVHARRSAYLLVLSGPIGGTLGLVLYGDFPIGRLHCAQECNSSIGLCLLPIGRLLFSSGRSVLTYGYGVYVCVCSPSPFMLKVLVVP